MFATFVRNPFLRNVSNLVVFKTFTELRTLSVFGSDKLLSVIPCEASNSRSLFSSASINLSKSLSSTIRSRSHDNLTLTEKTTGNLVTLRSYAKPAKGKGGGKEKTAGKPSTKATASQSDNEDEEEGAQEDADASEYDIKKYKELSDAAVRHFSKELTNIRSGRAAPGLLEPVLVQVENSKEHLALKDFAAVTARNPQLLVVSCFSKDHVKDVIKAIENSPLKLQAKEEAGEILVPVPRLTLDVIKKMIKMVNQEAEAARKSVRAARHKALEASKKAGGGVDAATLRERDIGKFIDAAMIEINKVKAQKEAELNSR